MDGPDSFPRQGPPITLPGAIQFRGSLLFVAAFEFSQPPLHPLEVPRPIVLKDVRIPIVIGVLEPPLRQNLDGGADCADVSVNTVPGTVSLYIDCLISSSYSDLRIAMF